MLKLSYLCLLLDMEFSSMSGQKMEMPYLPQQLQNLLELTQTLSLYLHLPKIFKETTHVLSKIASRL